MAVALAAIAAVAHLAVNQHGVGQARGDQAAARLLRRHVAGRAGAARHAGAAAARAARLLLLLLGGRLLCLHSVNGPLRRVCGVGRHALHQDDHVGGALAHVLRDALPELRAGMWGEGGLEASGRLAGRSVRLGCRPQPR